MEILKTLFQIIVPLGIFNVWFLRFGKATEYRGGDATNMREEFAAYGIPYPAMLLIGFLKVLFAVMLLLGFIFPFLVQPAAVGMSIMMAGAVSMHVKVGDAPKKMMPAAAMLAMALVIAFA